MLNSLDKKQLLYPSKLGEFIKQRRKMVRMNQYELAAAAETKQNYISMIENGHEQPSIDWIVRVADALGMSDNPGQFFNALADRLGPDGLLKNSKMLQLPVDFTVEEMVELEDYLKFILWKREYGSEPFTPTPARDPLASLNDEQMEAMYALATAFEGKANSLEDFIKFFKKQNSSKSTPKDDTEQSV